MSMEQPQETWQIESSGQILDTNFEELTTLIDQGHLLRIDRVRKGNLRWIEAGKVPALVAVFNAKDGEQPDKPVITLTKLGPTTVPGNAAANPANPSPEEVAAAADQQVSEEPVCSMHEDLLADYVCSTCFSNFCGACPKSYGGNVKICPYCGAMCESLAKAAAAEAHTANYSAAMGEGFGFADFANALAYPFKFKSSLFIGAAMYAFFSIGSGAMGFGGIFMMSAALGSFLLANTLRFGILSNTIENFAQGKIGENFMPSFDDFSLWDDVIHPFFLSIGVYLVSFGPLIVLGIAAFFFVSNAVSHELGDQVNQMNRFQSDAAQAVAPETTYAAKAAQQSQAVRELLNKTNEKQKQRIAEMEEDAAEDYDNSALNTAPHSIAPEAEAYNRKNQVASNDQHRIGESIDISERPPVPVDASEETVMQANESIKQLQRAQAESVLGKTDETKSAENLALIKQLLGYGLIFLLLAGVCLLWGLFYFPAACAVAGYTQSFAATVNPSVGFDTIKRLGVDYLKILLMTFIISLMAGSVAIAAGIILSPFGLPGMGNIPAGIITDLFGFYFAVVFSCVLGFALYKAGDRLKLPS